MINESRNRVGNYILGRVLAAGDFDCRTRMCTHCVTGVEYVVRIYEKRVLRETQWMLVRVKEAIHVMRTLPKHENIIEVVECFETDSTLYILMQLFAPQHITKLYTATGSDGKKVVYPLETTRAYFRQVVHAVLHMHEHSVVHLGIAPDHIMVNNKGSVKLGNTISCLYCARGKKLSEMRGTMHTVAPEVLRGEMYNPYLADSWALGVVLFFMLNGGSYPHDGANTTKSILYGRMRRLNPSVPHAAKDLVGRLLHAFPNERMTVEDILSHPFMVAENLSDIVNSVGIVPSPHSTLISNFPQAHSPTSLSYGSPETSAFSPNTLAVRASDAQSAAVVESTWDYATDTLRIRLPYGLSKEEEAAFIIQHMWRGYKQWSHLASAWTTPRTSPRRTSRRVVALVPAPPRDDGGAASPVGRRSSKNDQSDYEEPVFSSAQTPPTTLEPKQWRAKKDSVVLPSLRSSVSLTYNSSATPPEIQLSSDGQGTPPPQNLRLSPASPLDGSVDQGQTRSRQRGQAKKGGKVVFAESGSDAAASSHTESNCGAVGFWQTCPVCHRPPNMPTGARRRPITDNGPFPRTPYRYTPGGFVEIDLLSQ